MSGEKLLKEERRKLTRAHGLIYVFPIRAGLLTASLAVTAEHLGNPITSQIVLPIAFLVNAFLAGVASAIVVANQHPHDRGKWWRAGTSFLFAFPMTLASTTLFGMLANCSGALR